MDSRIPEKRPGDNIESLEAKQRTLNNVKARGSFNAEFWARSSEVEDIAVRRMETERKISWRDLPGTESEWAADARGQSKGRFEQNNQGWKIFFCGNL